MEIPKHGTFLAFSSFFSTTPIEILNISLPPPPPPPLYITVFTCGPPSYPDMHGEKNSEGKLEGRRKQDPSLMAETSPLKRRREAAPDEEEEEKRQKPYKDILSLLEEEEDVPGQDLSSLIASLQQELASGPGPSAASAAKEADPEAPSSSAPPSPSPAGGGGGGGGGGDERERVMRRLLEASDDELGLPSRESSEAGDGVGVEEGDDGPCGGGGEGQGWIDLCEGLVWELEDEAADQYALLRPELSSPLEWWVN